MLPVPGLMNIMMPCYLSPIFKHSDTKWDTKNLRKHSRSYFRGHAHAAPPSKSATDVHVGTYIVYAHVHM